MVNDKDISLLLRNNEIERPFFCQTWCVGVFLLGKKKFVEFASCLNKSKFQKWNLYSLAINIEGGHSIDELIWRLMHL
jgi:hypothetical protein